MDYIFKKVNYEKAFEILKKSELGQNWIHIINNDILGKKQAIKYFKTDSSELSKIGLAVCEKNLTTLRDLNNHISFYYLGKFLLSSKEPYIYNSMDSYIEIYHNSFHNILIDRENIDKAMVYLAKSAQMGNSCAQNLIYLINYDAVSLISSINMGYYPNLYFYSQVDISERNHIIDYYKGYFDNNSKESLFREALNENKANVLINFYIDGYLPAVILMCQAYLESKNYKKYFESYYFLLNRNVNIQDLYNPILLNYGESFYKIRKNKYAKNIFINALNSGKIVWKKKYYKYMKIKRAEILGLLFSLKYKYESPFVFILNRLIIFKIIEFLF